MAQTGPAGWRGNFFINSLTFVRTCDIFGPDTSEVKKMSPRTGRPTSNKKTGRLELRLAPDEYAMIQECADKLGTTKAQVILRGVQLLKAELDKK